MSHNNKKQEIIDARMRATKARLAGPKPDYSINKGVKDWDTLFFHAAMHADVKGMKKALKKGANINWQNPSNLNSPAHVAAWMGKSNAKVLKWLKKKGADMTLKDTKGRTPADVWAMTKDQKDMTKGLIRYRKQQEGSSIQTPTGSRRMHCQRCYLQAETPGGRYAESSATVAAA